jgi:miniconductance mechanosensitive channel
MLVVRNWLKGYKPERTGVAWSDRNWIECYHFDAFTKERKQMLEQLESIHPFLPAIAGLLALLIAAVIVDLVAKRILIRLVRVFAKRSSVTWDDALVEHNVFGRLVQVVPALIIYAGVSFIPDLADSLVQLIRNVAMAYMVLMLTLGLTAMLSAANTIYSALPVARDRPLKGFVQLLQIVVWIVGAVVIVSALLDRSPLLLLSGFGAMTAILLLVFKDTILSLVASVQLTAQDMVRVGDWIEMPQFGADGDVVDVQLHTIKVQNWDKTITTIPTHRLISESFKNWRGMSQAGGRRIKRAIYIDVSTIRVQTPQEVERFTRFALLKDYIKNKEQELADYNAGLKVEVDAEVNQRRLTNIGTFRAYALNYLKNHPKVRKDMTLIVRQLPPGPEGLPLEVYCFTTTTAWADYEDIQSDIFDHLLAIVPEFGLRLFQKPAGSDLANLKQ